VHGQRLSALQRGNSKRDPAHGRHAQAAFKPQCRRQDDDGSRLFAAVKQRCIAIAQQEATHMLSEKFILVLEALLKSNDRVYPDGAPKVVSNSPHVPVRLPAGK
jgi:hypothetical protein